MKASNFLLFILGFLSCFACNKKTEKKKSDYTDYDYGYYYLWKTPRQPDSAFYKFSRYVEHPDDTLNKASAYRYMGDIQWSLGDLDGAQQSLTNAIATLDTSDDEHRKELGIVYNLLGNIKLDLHYYDDALKFYDSAKILSRGTGYDLEILNGKAVTFQKMGRYKEAVGVYDSILALKPTEQEFVARMIDNRAKTKWMMDSSYNPLPEFRAALKIRVDSNNISGLNTSFAHISDYYSRLNRDSALWYANKMYEKATESQNPYDVLEATIKSIRLNNDASSKELWFEKYKSLNDSLQFSRDTTSNRFALAKYDYSKNKEENVTLHKHISIQRIVMIGLIILAVMAISGLSFWFGKRRRKIEQESEIAIRNSKLKTSQKVHDVVANGLYGIMNELEHKTSIDKEPLINKIEDLYEKSRNISHEDIASHSDKAYDAQIHELLNAFSNDETGVFIVGNQPEFWSNITSIQKHELLLVLKELLVNMKKHSGAKNVVVQFKKQDGIAYINYKDDGVGFPATETASGKGLENTVSRINSLNGKVTFGKNDKGGASVAINFPTQS